MMRLPQGYAPLQPYGGAPLPSPDFAGFAGATDPLAKEIDLARLWRTLVRRRRLFFMVFVGFVAAVALFTFLKPRQYTTQLKLIAGSQNTTGSTGDAGTQLPVLNALLAAGGVQSAETYAELMQQPGIAAQVAKDLGLNVAPNAMLQHVTVRPVTNTPILTLAVAWSDPATSAKIANDFATVFVESERQLIAHQADSALAFLQNELPDAERRMRAAQDALSGYQQRAGIADLTTQTQNSITSLSNIEAKQQTAELEARQAEASLVAVRAQLAATQPTIVGSQNVASNPVSQQLQQQVSSLQVQLNTARQQYTDSHPTVVTLKSQLAQAERELAKQPQSVVAGTQSVPNPVYQQLTQQEGQLEAQLASSKAQADTLRAQHDAASPSLAALPDRARRIGELQRDAKAAETFYDALQRKYQDALLSRSTALADVSITQQASADVYTISPNVLFNLTIGLVLGLVLAVTSVFLAEFLDDRFRREEDVRERLGLPVLASIPQLGTDEGKDTAWVKPLSVESFFQLVASLRYSSNQPPRTIAFTSADQGDGKSTIAVNTAITLGLMKARVLLVDADLRRPTVHTKLGVANEAGLSDVLVDVARFTDAVKPTTHQNVSVITSGRPAPNPVGLLQSLAFERFLHDARERFDFVIIDGPALRSIVDGVVLGAQTEGTVLVVNAARSEGRAVRGALAKLRAVGSINLVGIVLNAVKPEASDYSDYYLGAGQSISLPAKTGA